MKCSLSAHVHLRLLSPASMAQGGPAEHSNGQEEKARASVSECLRRSFNAARDSDWNTAAEAARAALSADPKDSDALSCFATSLVRLDRPRDALPHAHAALTSSAGVLAYCHYRHSRLHDALSVLSGAPEPLASSIRGQCQYRQGKFVSAASSFHSAIHNGAGFESRVNALAAAAASGGSADLDSPVQPLGECFEEEYNAASIDLQRGDNDAAERRLLRARKLGNESLVDEGLSSEEIAEELRPVDALLAVSSAFRADAYETSSRAIEVLNSETFDANAVATAAIAVASISSTAEQAQEALQALERISPTAGTSETKLSRRLSKDMRQKAKEVRSAMLLVSGQPEKARLAAAAAAATAAGSDLPTLVQAAASVQSKRYVKAEGVLDGKHSEQAAIARAHVNALRGNFIDATKTLAASSLASYPAVAATILSMAEAAGKPSRAYEPLRKCVARCEDQESQVLPYALDEFALLNAELGQPQHAAELLQRFLRVTTDSYARMRALARLSILLPEEQAKEASLELPAPDTEDLLSVEELVSEAKQTMYNESVRQVAAESANVSVSRTRKRKNRRKRKKPLPQNASPEGQPDPERWIPKKDRSNAVKSKGKKKREQQKGAGAQQAVSVAQAQQQYQPKPQHLQEASSSGGPRRGGRKRNRK